eukprot:scaffold21158_cov62-Phaeocystis_antarctica.AAC.8
MKYMFEVHSAQTLLPPASSWTLPVHARRLRSATTPRPPPRSAPSPTQYSHLVRLGRAQAPCPTQTSW